MLLGMDGNKKGFLTEEYKKAHEKEREICKKCLGIDIGEAS